MIDRGNRKRPDNTPVWPLRPEDLPSLAGPCASEQRKQTAILERRVAASRGIEL